MTTSLGSWNGGDEVPEHGGPAIVAADLAADGLGLVAEALEIAVFEINASPVALLGEAELDLGDEARVVAELAVQLPGQHQPRRWLPDQYPSPLAFAAVFADLVP